MSKITEKNMQSHCRTCLARLGKSSALPNNKYNIHETHQLAEWLKECTAIIIDPGDKLPQFVCRKCFEKLRDFNEFRCMSLQSMETLTTLLTDGKIKSKSRRCKNKDQPSQYADLPELETKNPLCLSLQTEPIETNPLDMGILKVELEDPVLLGDIKLDIGSPLREMQIPVSEIKTDVDDLADAFQQHETKAPLPEVQLKHSPSTEIDGNSAKELNNASTESESVSSRDSLYKPAKKRIYKKTRVKKPGTGTKMLRCELCSRRCGNAETLAAHMRTHEGLKPYECVECKRSYNRASHYRIHMREVHPAEKKEIRCSYEGCDKVFQRETCYKAHVRNAHVYTDRTRYRCICEQCGRTFRNVTKLKEHSYRHADVTTYPYKCDQCGKCFNKKESYKEHLLRHAGIKNFVCSFCGQKKTTREELRAHMNCHTKLKQWTCEICQAVFTKSANMARHVRVVHEGEKKYACRYCDLSFGKPDTWKHHEMRHTGEKPHGCEICGKRFIQVVALRTHMKTHAKYGHVAATAKPPSQPLQVETKPEVDSTTQPTANIVK